MSTLLLGSLLLGLVLGSFANVCILRIPRGRSVVWPRSACPRCGSPIAWHQNIPIASYVWLRGRCASCRAPISPRYALVEALMAALLVALTWKAPDIARLALGTLLTLQLLIIAFIDIDHQIIPDGLSAALAATGLAAIPWNALLGAGPFPKAASAAVGAATGLLLLWAVAAAGTRIWKKEALGGGDVKLMAALGLWLGWRGVFFTLFAGSLLGTLWTLSLMARRRFRRGTYLPFGPFLAAAAWLCWFLGGPPAFFR